MDTGHPTSEQTVVSGDMAKLLMRKGFGVLPKCNALCVYADLQGLNDLQFGIRRIERGQFMLLHKSGISSWIYGRNENYELKSETRDEELVERVEIHS
jgi:hypothetical protein